MCREVVAVAVAVARRSRGPEVVWPDLMSDWKAVRNCLVVWCGSCVCTSTANRGFPDLARLWLIASDERIVPVDDAKERTKIFV